MLDVKQKLNELNEYIQSSDILTFRYSIINDNNIIAKREISIKNKFNKFIDTNSIFTLSKDLIYFIDEMFFDYNIKYDESKFTIYRVGDE